MDTKRQATTKSFTEGQKVLVKKMIKNSKMESFYEEQPYTITKCHKNSAELQRKGNTHTFQPLVLKKHEDL